MRRRIHIVGRKNSGKTTLIAELVLGLSQRGLRVGTIKHTHHHHELDTPGKDSHTHREAGAAVVGILAAEMSAVFRPARVGDEKAIRYEAMMPLFADCDVVLVEGDSQAVAPKLEVWRHAIGQEPLATSDQAILAVITDDPLGLSIPKIRRADAPLIMDTVLGLVRRS